MKFILITAALILACLLSAGCRKDVQPAQPRADAADKAATAREQRRMFEEKYNKGVNCLSIYSILEVRVSRLLEYTRESPELEQALTAQRLLLEQAEGCFREALRIDPNAMMAHQALAQVTVKLGKYDDAIKHGSLVLEKSPARMQIYQVLAVAYQRKGGEAQSPEQRREFYEKAAGVIMQCAPRDKDSLSQAHMYTYLGEICGELARMLTGAERIKQYDRIIEWVGGYLAQYPDNEFAEEMRTMVDVAREIKEDFESGYE